MAYCGVRNNGTCIGVCWCFRVTGAVLLLSCLINEIGSSLLSTSADNADSTILVLQPSPQGRNEMSIERTNHDKVVWESWIVKNYLCCSIWCDFWMIPSIVISCILYSRSAWFLHLQCSRWSEAFDTFLSQVSHVEEEWRGRLEKQDKQETGSCTGSGDCKREE